MSGNYLRAQLATSCPTSDCLGGSTLVCLSVLLSLRCLSVCRFEFCAEIKKLIPNKNKEYYIGLKFGNWSSLLPDSECSTSFRLTRFPLSGFCTHFCHVDKHQCFALFSHHLRIFPCFPPPLLLLCLVLFLWLHFCVLHSGNWAGNWHISLTCWSWPSGRGDSSKQKLFSGILLMRRLRPQRRRLRCRLVVLLLCSVPLALRIGFTLFMGLH